MEYSFYRFYLTRAVMEKSHTGAKKAFPQMAGRLCNKLITIVFISTFANLSGLN
jgi:hypothetical protein